MQSRKHGKAFTSLLLPIGNTRWEEEGEGNKQCLVVVPETAKKYNHCEILDAAFWGWGEGRERGEEGELVGTSNDSGGFKSVHEILKYLHVAVPAAAASEGAGTYVVGKYRRMFRGKMNTTTFSHLEFFTATTQYSRHPLPGMSPKAKSKKRPLNITFFPRRGKWYNGQHNVQHENVRTYQKTTTTKWSGFWENGKWGERGCCYSLVDF